MSDLHGSVPDDVAAGIVEPVTAAPFRVSTERRKRMNDLAARLWWCAYRQRWLANECVCNEVSGAVIRECGWVDVNHKADTVESGGSNE